MPESDRSLTLVIPTHQRRAALARLLEGLRDQLARPGAGAGVDVLVVVDGSTDGSAEYVEAVSFPVPTTVIRQPNAGLAAARNRGLAEAAGELVWFLDDDMVPTGGLVAEHRRAHRDERRRLVMGPCPFPPEGRPLTMVREWAASKHLALARAGRLEQPALFSAANTSGPGELWSAIGGFDERFVGWGGEDYELAVRLLAAGIEVGYEPRAVAWHHQRRGIAGFCATKRDEGRNTVRIVRKHPGAEAELLPAADDARRLKALRFVARDHPLAYAGLALGAAAAAVVAALVAPRRAERSLHVAARLSFIAGVADLDRGEGYLERLLGAGPAAPSRRDSSQPCSRPTGSQ